LGRLQFSIPLETWFEKALNYPGIQLLAPTPEIAIASTRLPGKFHRDPADQLIVATAQHYNCPLLTSDDRIANYPHVITVH
jgi:PIN domain nuclease of toxin-antitoxin system